MNFTMFGQVRSFSTGDSNLQERLHSGKAMASDKVAIIKLEGAIMSGEGYVKRQIDRIRDDDRVKAVVLRVDSPGGTVTGSHYIYHHLKKLREEKKIPLVVSMGGMCASGGYYVSMAVGDEPGVIYAEPTTWTGSIGVIIPNYNISELLDQWNIKDNSITSGPLKQMGSPTRMLDDEGRARERAVLQALVDESFTEFKDVVGYGRPALRQDPERLEQATTGQIFTARQAKELGLVDKIGFLEDAVRQAARIANLDPDNVRVVEYRQPVGLLDAVLFGPQGNSPLTASQGVHLADLLDMTTPRAYYLCTWLPAIMTNQAR